MIRRLWLAPALLGACVTPHQVGAQLQRAEATLARAHQADARRCAPLPLAQAQAAVDFARIELRQGDVDRAWQHAEAAQLAGLAAVSQSTDCAPSDP